MAALFLQIQVLTGRYILKRPAVEKTLSLILPVGDRAVTPRLQVLHVSPGATAAVQL